MRFQLSEILFALLGGAIMAAVSSLYFYLYGKMIGFSSIFKGILTCSSNCKWQIPFVTGFFALIVTITHTKGYIKTGQTSYLYVDPDAIFVNYMSFIGIILAAFLMGFGSGLTGGCTSDHGVSGLPRCTTRSLFSMIMFTAVAMLVASLRYHLDIANHVNYHYSNSFDDTWRIIMAVFLLVMVILSIIYVVRGCTREGENKWQAVNSFTFGYAFGVGLMFSGLLRPSNIASFLTLNKFWNPAVAFVFLAIFLVNFFTYRYVIKTKQRALYAEELEVPVDTKINARLVFGSIFFGSGWAMGLLAPGPAVGNFLMHPELILYTPIVLVTYTFTDWLVRKVTKSNDNQPSGDHEEAPLVS